MQHPSSTAFMGGNMCFCDKPDCERQPCRDLRELRIAYRVVKRLYENVETIDTAQDVLDEIEFECEILCK